MIISQFNVLAISRNIVKHFRDTTSMYDQHFIYKCVYTRNLYMDRRQSIALSRLHSKYNYHPNTLLPIILGNRSQFVQTFPFNGTKTKWIRMATGRKHSTNMKQRHQSSMLPNVCMSVCMPLLFSTFFFCAISPPVSCHFCLFCLILVITQRIKDVHN